MRISNLFFKTFKEAPADAEIASHKLLEQAGYLKRIGRGLFAYTPLMWRVFNKLSSLIREEMTQAGAQEICLPLLHPATLWKKTGRWADFQSERLLYTLTDREDHEFCIAPTHEEVVTHLISDWVTSYKALPLNLYQIGSKFRDEIRPRFGLMRSREFYMKDGYSFSQNREEMEVQYQTMHAAYCRIFERLGLDFVVVQAHSGKIGKGKSEEFQVKASVGEDLVMVAGDLAVNAETAKAIPPSHSFSSDQKEKQLVDTPNRKNISKLAEELNCEPWQILKCVVLKLLLSDREEFVVVAIRGDREVNLVKVTDHFEAIEVAAATDEEIENQGLQPGFIGPIGLSLPLYADSSAQPMTNFVAAVNQKDKHALNVNWGRDCPLPPQHDFLLAEAGDQSVDRPQETFVAQRGIEVGHIFNIETLYSEKMGAFFQDEDGKTKPFWMGTYGIGVGRLAAACIEQTHDGDGLIWPLAIAPFKVVIVPATMKNPELTQAAETFYRELAPFDPLYDDRNERLGFKLRDSNLIGIPYKLILGKSFQNEGKIEIENRRGEKELLDPSKLSHWAEQNLACEQIRRRRN